MDKVITCEYLSESLAALYISQCLSVLKFLHNKNLIHKFLRTESILIKQLEDSNEIKISDIGNAFKHQYRNILIENPQYTAPEALRKRQWTSKCDIWSCGVILYTLLVGYLPFHGSKEQVYQ